MVALNHSAVALAADFTLPSTQTHRAANATRDDVEAGIESALWKGPATLSTASHLPDWLLPPNWPLDNADTARYFQFYRGWTAELLLERVGSHAPGMFILGSRGSDPR